jgi:Acetyltransferases
MHIEYTTEKKFTKEQIEELFLSVNWVSGQYPERLYKALMHSQTVLTAWDGEQLAGLVRVLDDTEMVAYIHYVLVNPKYQGQGIAKSMIKQIKEIYKNYLYLEIMPEDSKNIVFYEKLGFIKMLDGTAMNIENYNDKR